MALVRCIGLPAVTGNRPVPAHTDYHYYYSHGCLCDHDGEPTRECTCSAGSIARYQKRISGLLLDRIDIHVEVLWGT